MGGAIKYQPHQLCFAPVDMSPHRVLDLQVKFLYKCNVSGSGAGQDRSSVDSSVTDLINSAPIVAKRPNQVAMTPDVITNEGGTAVHANITYLNLHSNSIRKIENLAGLVSLQTLILSFNEVRGTRAERALRVRFLRGARG